MTNNYRFFHLGTLIIFCFVVVASVQKLKAEDFSGSFSFQVSQRFYDRALLGNVNGSSSWGAMNYAMDFGLFEWHGLEPRLGLAFSKDTSRSGATRFHYQLWSLKSGFRYKPYDYQTFFLVPYADLDLVATGARGYQKPLSGAREKIRTGYELGLNLGAGAFISFLGDAETRHELQSEWSIKDYGALFGLEWMKGGLVDSGSFFAVAKETSHWSFHLGLMIDW